MKPIILRTRTSTDECIGTVRLTPEAEKVVRRLRFKTGLPIRQIVSEIIVQAENLIDISGDDDEGRAGTVREPAWKIGVHRAGEGADGECLESHEPILGRSAVDEKVFSPDISIQNECERPGPRPPGVSGNLHDEEQ